MPLPHRLPPPRPTASDVSSPPTRIGDLCVGFSWEPRAVGPPPPEPPPASPPRRAEPATGSFFELSPSPPPLTDMELLAGGGAGPGAAPLPAREPSKLPAWGGTGGEAPATQFAGVVLESKAWL